jgi:hypothetical protein
MGIGLLVLCSILTGVVFDQAWLAVATGVGMCAIAWCLTNTFRSLVLYILVTVVVMFQAPREGKASMLDLLAGAVMIGLTVYWFVRIRIIEGQAFSVDRLHMLLVIYFVWSSVVGIFGMWLYGNSANDWLREMLIQLPLVLMPFLFVRSIKPGSKEERVIFMLAAIAWIVLIVLNLIHFRNNVLKAVYFYQTGRTTLDPTASILLFFACVSFIAIDTKRSHMKFYIFLSALALVTVILASYRTVWATIILIIPIIYFLSHPKERLMERRYGVRLGMLAIASLTYAFLKWKLVRLVITNSAERFLTTSHVSTDHSLVNRYIEWRMLLHSIKASPLVGYGYGGRYLDYDWLAGFSMWAAYSHNAFLYVLLKSGILGFIALFGAFIMLTLRALKLARSSHLQPYQRAVMRIAFGLSFCLLITSLTLNAMGERNSLLWLGMAWGAVMTYTEHDRNQALRLGS